MNRPNARATERGAERRDLAWLGALAMILLSVMLWPYAAHGYRFGIGPDMPVYLWWTRMGAAEGLSVVGARPGTPASIAVLAGALHLPVVAIAAGLQAALGPCIGTTAAVLIRGRTRDVPALFAWVVAGTLAGLFAVHLGAGYLANLAFVVAFLAAGVTLLTGGGPREDGASARGTGVRGAIAAAVLLAGGGLAHPTFFVVGGGILLAVAAWTAVSARDGPDGEPAEDRRADERVAVRRIVAAVVGAAIGVAAGIASMTLGPSRLDVDTSKDGFLRRAGLTSSLRSAYLERFIHRWTRYVQFVSIPLALPGARRTTGLVGRFLVVWTAATLVGASLGLISGWYPPDRLMTFSFSIPILAGVGVAWVWARLDGRPALAVFAVLALVGAMTAGALIAWGRQTPFLSPLEVDRATSAARIAGTTAAGTPLVFVVDDDDATATFLASRAANVIRASVPPERVSDVYVYVGTPGQLFAGEPTIRGEIEYDTLSRLSLEDIPAEPAPAVFVVVPFDRAPEGRTHPDLIRRSPGVFASIPGSLGSTPPARDPLEPSSPIEIALAAIAILAVVGVVGSGWSHWAVEDRVAAIALAPAFGLASLTIAAIALERLGLPLAGYLGPTIVVVVAAGLGFVPVVAERQTRAEAPPSL